FSTCPTGTDTTSRPRGIAFSPGGDTAYVAQFNNSIDPAVQMFVRGAGPVSVQREEGLIPSGFTLSQNYPNPFNPSTQIKFTLPEAGMTSLKVYDMLGREVATLVEESLAAGGYTATFDASKLSSGVYAYVLTSRGYRLSNKMVLVK
ncbi:MAG: T9SS type A sorting domain-containing protein, partial [Bacteroidota bacterium]